MEKENSEKQDQDRIEEINAIADSIHLLISKISATDKDFHALSNLISAAGSVQEAKRFYQAD